jgi:hypothetical protein
MRTSDPGAQNVLREIFSRVLQFSRRKFKRTPNLSLSVGCWEIERYRRKSKRSFCHVFHRAGIVCTVPVIVTLKINFIVGIFLHEVGHVIAMKEWNRSEEPDADLAVLQFLGVNLGYKSDLTLEWVPNDVVQRVLGFKLRER